MKDFNLRIEILDLLGRWISDLRRKATSHAFQKKTEMVHSIYAHFKPNGLGGFDWKNMQFDDVNEIARLCRYALQFDYDSPRVQVYLDMTTDALIREESK